MTFKYTESHITALLQERYSGQEWAYFPQLPNSTGGGTRSADGVAFNLFPSRGLEVLGFEIKVSRSDWLSELKKPEKSEAIQQFCDGWYIVAPADIVKLEELPKTWGLIIASETGLRIKVKAPELTPNQMDRNFIASIMRRSKEYVASDDLIRAKVDKSYREGLETGKSSAKCTIERLERENKELDSVIDKFREATGLYLGTHSFSRTVELFQAVKQLNGERLQTELDRKIYALEKELAVIKESRDLAIEQAKIFENDTRTGIK